MRTWLVFPQNISHVQKWTSYVEAFESLRQTDRTEIIYHTASRVVKKTLQSAYFDHMWSGCDFDLWPQNLISTSLCPTSQKLQIWCIFHKEIMLTNF